MLHNLRKQRALELLLVGVFFASVSAHGNAVSITNHSFENDAIARDGNTATQSSGSDDWDTNIVPTGWTGFDDGRGGTGGNRGIVSHATGSYFNASLGSTPEVDTNDQSFFTAARDIHQVLAATLEASTTYTLSVDIGDRDFSGGGGNVGDLKINLGYGNTGGLNILATLDSSSPGAVATVNGDWVTWTMSYTTDATPVGLGQPLRIELTTDTNVGWFDNVRLDAAASASFQVEIHQLEDDLVFEWPSQSGKVYDLLASANLDSPTSAWTPLSGQEEIPATPSTNTLTIPVPMNAMFYAVREREPTVVPPVVVPITVILLGGQSNMLGSGTVVSDLPTALQSPQTDVEFTYGGDGGAISGLTSLQSGSGLEYGPEITFGRTIADAYSSEKFALIKYTEGATDLENKWDPAGGSSHASFVAKVTQGMNALTAAGYTPTISAMLWTQGERDAREGYEATYEANLNAFIADMRTRYGANLPFFISQLSSGQTNLPAAELAGIRTAQANVATADANAHLIITDSFDLRTDNLHFSGAGQVSLGNAFAASYQAVFGP